MLVDLTKREIELIMSSLMNDDSEEARAAFDDFWKSDDVLLDIKDHYKDDDDK